jgi:hypothetical protein
MDVEKEMFTLATCVRARLPELAARIHERSVELHPEYYRTINPAVLDLDKRSVSAALASIVDGLGNGRTPPEAATGAEMDAARFAARENLDLQALLHTYRIGHALTWEITLEEAESAIPDPDARLAALTLASRYLFEWNDRAMASLVQAYQQERDSALRSRERRTRELVREILDGLPGDTSRLGYQLAATHLCIIAWGGGAESITQRLAAHPGVAHLSVVGSDGAIVTWLGGEPVAGGWPTTDALNVPHGSHLALGRRSRGIEGFRQTHREAQQAYAVGLLRRASVTNFDNVSLEALVVGDLRAAREFVANELGPLGSDDERDAILRTTLKAYFQTGNNATSAAPMLGVHERTIAYRLRSIEQRLGLGSIARRRDELAVALRLHDMLYGGEASLDAQGAEQEALSA